MRPPVFILFVCLSIAAICGVSCSTTKTWPPPHAQVRAYLYNLDSHGDVRFFKKGHFNTSVVDTNGVRLDERQVDRFLAAVTGSHSDHNIMGCYVPHHAFVFYDKKHKVTGWVELCFGCGNYRVSSRNAPEWLDINDLEDLAVELGLPVFKNFEDYSRLKKDTAR